MAESFTIVLFIEMDVVQKVKLCNRKNAILDTAAMALLCKIDVRSSKRNVLFRR